MQSPEKLQAQLAEMLGPPGPESDPLELMLRTVVATGGPMLEQLLSGYSDEQLDVVLEDVALFFLRQRSDGVTASDAFLRELAELQRQALEHASTIQGETAAAPLPAAAAQPAAAPDEATRPPEPAVDTQPIAPPVPPASAPAPAQQTQPPVPGTAPAPPAPPADRPPAAPWEG